MREIRTSSLMSGDGRRGNAGWPSYCAHPRLYVRPEGAFHQWREDPPGELSIALVADERFGWVTNWIEAS